jgi:hypothetical protein
VAISGDTALIGAYGVFADGVSGAAYVFVRSGSVWSQQQKLRPGEGGVWFGWSAAISGDMAVVGSPFSGDAGSNSGSAYVFVRSGGVWSRQKLTASDAATGDVFGYSVAISGDTAVVGSPGDSDAGFSSGSAYVFVRSGGLWSQQQKLTVAGLTTGDSFGWSVAVSGDAAVVGAHGGPRAGASSGSAYVFARSGAVWSPQQKLTASDATPGDRFGYSVALSGDTAIIGAPNDTNPVFIAGSAYVYEPGLTALSPARVWVGLKNSDDVGIRFDIQAKVYLNGAPVGSGQLDGVPGGSSGFNNAALRSIPLTLTAPVAAHTDDTLRIDVLVRNACSGSGKSSGAARLWYNGQPLDSGASRDAGSRFDATIGGTSSDDFLRSGFALSTTAGSSRTSADASVNGTATCPARPFTSFGSWSRTLP